MKTEVNINGYSLTGGNIEGYLTTRPDYSPPVLSMIAETIKGRQSPSIKPGDFMEGSLSFSITTRYKNTTERDSHRLTVSRLVNSPTFSVNFSGNSVTYFCISGGLTITERDLGAGTLIDVLDFSLSVVNTVKK